MYCRVSTADGRQTVANQIADLTAVADRLGWQVTEVITDEASGTKGREKRPGYDRLLTAITRREIDMVAVWGVDRLARSLSELVGLLAEVQNRGVDLYLHRQAVDTSTPAGRALFHMLGVFAEFERALIVDRVQAGLQRAKAEGKRLGRPALPDAIRLRIERELRRDTPVRSIARKFKIAPVTVRRIRAELSTETIIQAVRPRGARPV
ncbi:MAG: recombinase family protein [Ferrovibrio sp.]|uniref:recombinase family protein n=1 Tax=Ferrovibrio sp. TaxID=1917215 RepID=UPI003918BCB9